MESLNPPIEDYAQAWSSPEPDILKELNQETHDKASKPRMLSGHLQGRILSMFAHMVRPKQVLDIGTYTGYSAICLAEGLKEGGVVRTVDKNDELQEIVERYIQKAGFTDRISYHLGNALELIDEWEGPFDLVFIDADKENYTYYYDRIFDRVPSGGYIIADNVLWKGKVLESKEEADKLTQAIHTYNEKIRADERVENVILPVRDGLSIARKR